MKTARKRQEALRDLLIVTQEAVVLAAQTGAWETCEHRSRMLGADGRVKTAYVDVMRPARWVCSSECITPPDAAVCDICRGPLPRPEAGYFAVAGFPPTVYVARACADCTPATAQLLRLGTV